MNPRNLRKRWWFAAAGLLIAGSLLLTRNHTPLARTLGWNDADALQCDPDPGALTAYRVRLNSEIKLNPAALLIETRAHKSGQMIASSVGFSARMRVRAIEARKAGMFMALALDEIETTAGSQLAADVRDQLTTPFYGVLSRDCSWSEFAFDASVSEEVVNRTQALLQGVSLALEQDSQQRAWTKTEYDAVGQYSARYERDLTEPLRVLKQRQTYLRTHPNAGFAFKEQLLTRVLESNTPATLDERFGWLAKLDSTEHLQITRLSGSVVADLKSTLSLEQSDEDVPALVLARTDAELRWRKAGDAPLVAPPSKPVPPDAMKTMPLAAALAEYEAILRSGRKSATAQAADYLALYLRARPEMALELMALLEREQVPTDIEAPMFLGLELAGTPEARRALIAGLGDEHAPRNRARAAAALPDIPKPDVATLDALTNAAQHAKAATEDEATMVRHSATYAVGTLEQRVRDADPALAEQARSAMQQAIARASTDQERAAALDAVGNSGNASLLADIKPLLTTQETLVRAHAIQAMAHMDPAANQDLFQPLIAHESDAQVRGSIAVTYAEQAKRANQAPPSMVVDAAIAQLAQEPDPRVRGLLIELIGPACADSTKALPALAMQFQRETDPILLRLIGKYVPGDRLGQ